MTREAEASDRGLDTVGQKRPPLGAGLKGSPESLVPYSLGGYCCYPLGGDPAPPIARSMDLMFIRRRSDLFEPSHQPRENARRRCDGHGEGVAWRLTGIVLIDNHPDHRREPDD